MAITLEEIKKKIEDTENSDETIAMLEKAMEFYCSNYDICEGYKHALYMCLEDQYNNHDGMEDEDNQQAVRELSDILDRAI